MRRFLFLALSLGLLLPTTVNAENSNSNKGMRCHWDSHCKYGSCGCKSNNCSNYYACSQSPYRRDDFNPCHCLK
ncbi:hypothetical protein [Prochlorococcus sp. MIT 0916]|uniref:hypothetical protein n=1 Tax=Prochlorococcus sp. MIT 0916 TaxID=3082521 RepID=UPI0039B3C597